MNEQDSPQSHLDRDGLLAWLREDDPAQLERLWAAADETRRRRVGDAVHLRGLIEISNHCVRACGYCGLRAANREIERYRMSADEILACAHAAKAYGWGTVVIQSGEDYGLKTEWVAEVVQRIKTETGLAVTLSLGERPDTDLAAWGRRARTVTFFASRPPTRSSTGSSTPICRAASATAWPCWRRCGAWATRWAAA